MSAAAWAASVETLHHFSTDSVPFALALSSGRIAIDGDVIYGTLLSGGKTSSGATGRGMLYKIKIDGSGFTPLHVFAGPDGSSPKGVTLSGGVLYGLTLNGGESQGGTLYKINKDGTGFTIIRAFPLNSGQPSLPAGGLVEKAGMLYGTRAGASTALGGEEAFLTGGEVFQLDLSNDSYQQIREFLSPFGPIWLQGSLLLDGTTLYGTSTLGGPNYLGSIGTTYGSVFRMELDGSGFSVLRNFQELGGHRPIAGVTKVGNQLFGTTGSSAIAGPGVVYRLNIDGTGYSVLHSFSFGRDGGTPRAELLAIGTVLFGTTAPNNFSSSGTIFKINTNGSGYEVVHNFTNGADGGMPMDGLVHSGGIIYGTTSKGGSNDQGVLFRYDLRPAASAGAVSTTPGVAAAITLSATGPAVFPTTSYEVLTGPTRGTLSGTAPNLTYTPAAGFVGSDSFTFKARNEVAESGVATVTINVASTFAPGAYFGTIASTPAGSFALITRPDRTGTLLVQLEGNRALLAHPTIAADGSFSVVARDLTAPGGTGSTISGQVTGGAFSATIAGGVTLTATAVPADSALAGSYSARALGATATEAYLVVANNSTYTLLVSDGTVQATVGPAPQGGALSTTLGTTRLNGTLSGSTGTFTGTLISPTGNAVTLAGLSDTVTPVRRLANISTRGFVGSGDAVLIVGFVLQGPASKPLLVRAAGPALTGFGLPGALTRPKLELNQGQTLLATNSDWSAAANAAEISTMTTNLGAFAFANGSADAAVFRPLTPNGYTTVISGEGGTSGIALVEVYDTAGGDATRLVNLSSRGFVGSGDQTLIVGLIVSGNAPKPLLIRASGPALTALGLTGAVSDPKLEILQGTTVVAANDNWEQTPRLTAAATAVGAFNFPAQSKDAALVVVLAPGQYSVKVEGVSGASGVSLAEIYELP